MIVDPIPVQSNVRIRAYECGELMEERTSHNVLTNVGRNWLRDLVGAKDFSSPDPSTGYIDGGDERTSERAMYIGFGVGGVLSSDPAIYHATQEELVTVTAVEDYVKIDSSPTYLKAVLNQTDGSDSIVGSYAIRFITTILESEISYAGNTSKSGASVGTSVPVSEAGLYLSGADPDVDLDTAPNSTRCVAYNQFDPITVTPNIVLRVEWELRF